MADAVAETVRRFGRLDGAFNNAGMGGTHRRLHEVDAKTFDDVLATNLRGPFLCMKYEVPAMIETGGGAIVNTSSIGGLVGAAGNADYAASKFGLEGLVRARHWTTRATGSGSTRSPRARHARRCSTAGCRRRRHGPRWPARSR